MVGEEGAPVDACTEGRFLPDMMVIFMGIILGGPSALRNRIRRSNHLEKGAVKHRALACWARG